MAPSVSNSRSSRWPRLLRLHRAGTFRIGGTLEVNRLGYGAMRITGRGIWGEPADRAEALRTLKRLPELGVNFIDTADLVRARTCRSGSIREALHPYGSVVVATKAGLARTGPDQWTPLGRPEYPDPAGAQEPAAARRGEDRPLAAPSHRSQGAAG